MRGLFLTIQLCRRLRDHARQHPRAPTADPARGRAGRVRERDRYRTVYGPLALIEARAGPEPVPADPAEALTRLGERLYTWPELCRLAGVEHAVADRLWRAPGFLDVPADARLHGDDVRALEIAAEGIDGLSDAERQFAVELMVREARGVGAHPRIAEIEVDAVAEPDALGYGRRRWTRRSSAVSSSRIWGGCSSTPPATARRDAPSTHNHRGRGAPGAGHRLC